MGALADLASVEARIGDVDAAVARVTEALDLVARLERVWLPSGVRAAPPVAGALEASARVVLARDAPVAAHALLAAASRLRHDTHEPAGGLRATRIDNLLAAVREALPEGEHDRAWAVGLELEDPIAFARDALRSRVGTVPG